MVTASVDISALKARHPLGDVVEAAGVRLRGRGRVRQGVCPFHDEAEGSFTVYEDSQKFWCFGCGEGGDVLDFLQRLEGLSLPEAIARLDGSPGLAPRSAHSSSPNAAGLRPPRCPQGTRHAADCGGALLRRLAPAFPRSAGVTWPRGASAPSPQTASALGYAPGSGLRQALESLGFSEKRITGLGAVHGAGFRAVRRHGRRSRTPPAPSSAG